MKLQDLQNLSLETRQRIFYAVVGISAVILFSFWIDDSLKRISQFSEKYKGQKTINSTANYSESMQKAKDIMDRVNKQMEQDLQKYDPEFQALEKMASSSMATSSTSTILNTTSTTTTINIQ